MANNTIVVNVLGNVRGLKRSLSEAQQSIGGLNKIGGELGGSLKLAGIAIAGFGAAAVGAGAVGAAALAGVGLAALGAGIAVAAQNEKVKAAFSDMSKHVMGELTKITAPFVPVLVKGAATIGKAFDALAPSLGNIFKAAAPLLDQLFAKLVPLAEKLGPVLETAFSAAQPVLLAFMDGLTPIVEGLGKFFEQLKSPAFATFTTGFMTAIGQLLPALGQLLAGLAPLGAQILPLLVSAFQNLVNLILQYVLPVMTTIFNFIGEHQALFGQLAIAIGVAYVAFQGVGLVMALLAAGPVVLIVAAIAGLAYMFRDSLIPMVKSAIDWFKDMYNNHGPSVVEAFKKIWEAVQKMYESVKPVLAQLLETVKSAFEAIKAVVTVVVDVLMKVWNTWGDTLLSIATAAFKAVMGIVRGGLQVIQGIFEVVTAIFTGNWGKAWEGIKDIVSGAWTVIKSVVSLGFQAIKLVFTLALAALQAAWTLAWNAIKAFVGSIWSGIKTVVSKGFDAMMDVINGIDDKVKAAFKSAGTWLLDAGKAILDGLIRGITDKVDDLKDKLGSVTKLIPEWKGPLNKDKNLLFGAGQAIMGGLIRGIDSQTGDLKSQLKDVTGVIAGTAMPSLATPGFAGSGSYAAAPVQITVVAPVGSNPQDIGRELDYYLQQYSRFGGKRLSA